MQGSDNVCNFAANMHEDDRNINHRNLDENPDVLQKKKDDRMF